MAIEDQHMTNQIKGVITSSGTKTVKTKFGDKPTYQYTVDGVEFSSGFKREHAEGEMVTVGVQWKFNEWQKIPGSNGAGMPPAVNGGGSSAINAVATGGGYTPASRGTFPVKPTDGQMSIIRQNSMNRAVEIMAQYYQLGIIGVTISEDEYMKKLHETALTITDFNSGQDIMNLMAAREANLKAVQ